MLTPERHQLILNLLKEKSVVRIQELVELTEASESTLRRDLSELEENHLLIRVHGGASAIHQKLEEPTVHEKAVKQEKEKITIAKYAAQLINDRDTVFIDAGTTTSQMVPYLPQNIVVVTSSIHIVLDLLKRNIKTILLGGELKTGTLALVGPEAIKSISQFRFDKCFLGMNSVHLRHGLTTPDPDEAYIKQLALQFSDERYVLCDSDKFSRISFAKVADLNQVQIITDNGLDQQVLDQYRKLTKVEAVITT